jgi:hypothetical protein
MKLKDQTKIKVASLLYSIYTKCAMGTPFVLRHLIDDLKLTSNAQPVIKQFELFEKCKKVDGGHLYTWKKDAPNEHLFEQITLKIQEYTRNTNAPKKKPEPETVAPPAPENKVTDPFIVPELPPNTPGPLREVFNILMDALKQQTAYMLAMGGAVEDMQTKVDNLYAQLK